MANTKDIRNVCFLGHGGSGKTSLAEAILFLTKNSDRQGKVTDGNTVSDYDPEEIRRGFSIQSSLLSFNWKNAKINLLDTPGFFDFAGEVKQAVRVADCSVIAINAKSGIEVGTEFAFDYSDEAGIPKVIFVSKLDEENVKFDEIFTEAREKFGGAVCPVFAPFIENDKTSGYVDLIKSKYFAAEKGGSLKETPVPAAFESKIEEYKEILFESLAETSDELMEKYFENGSESFTDEEIEKAFNYGLKHGSIIPVFSGSASTLAGIDYLVDSIVKYFPSPLDRESEKIYEYVEAEENPKIKDVKIEEKGAASIFVFKTVADQFGKMSYFKVMNGSLKRDAVLKNLKSGQNEKFAHIYTLRGKKQTEVEELICGEIGVTLKLASTNSNDTLAASGNNDYVKIAYPEPFLTYALNPKAKGDEDKISTNISKLLEEDLTIKYENNAETRQMLMSGLGEMHIDVITSKLKNRYGISVEFSIPRMAYRETIKKKIDARGLHKKQSGGAGQFGDVHITFEPCDENPGLTFTETIFGGSVPKNYHPAVEKGLLECMGKGVLAGFPVVNLKANLFDGKYHDVDSNELSFKLAARLAFKQLTAASPVILEPIGELKVTIPDAIVGDIMGDLNKRRGRVMGLNPHESKKGFTVIDAEVPMAEMQTYTIQLRATSQGRGYYEFRFVRYEELPAVLSPKVIEDAKKFAQEDDE
ncbi:MAG: elongation factor G [Oscillospiraceae bacterium]|nr:elongation factor G [Oscillospiraceae bacterium]